MNIGIPKAIYLIHSEDYMNFLQQKKSEVILSFTRDNFLIHEKIYQK